MYETGYIDAGSGEPMPMQDSIISDFEDGATDLDIVQYMIKMINLLDEKIKQMEGRLD